MANPVALHLFHLHNADPNPPSCLSVGQLLKGHKMLSLLPQLPFNGLFSVQKTEWPFQNITQKRLCSAFRLCYSHLIHSENKALNNILWDPTFFDAQELSPLAQSPCCFPLPKVGSCLRTLALADACAWNIFSWVSRYSPGCFLTYYEYNWLMGSMDSILMNSTIADPNDMKKLKLYLYWIPNSLFFLVIIP